MSRKTTFAVAALLSLMCASSVFAQATKADSTKKKAASKMISKGDSMKKTGEKMEKAGAAVATKGTKIELFAHWDNSANNKYNPDPKATIRWGDQSWDEMLVPFVGVLVDKDANPAKVMKRAARAAVNAAP